MTQALVINGLVKHFPGPRRGRYIAAVNGVSLSVAQGETLALVGESGSGKSTIGRIALRLDTPTSGSVEVAGVDITRASFSALRPMRAAMQMIFQDPWGTLSPKARVRRALEEPLLLHTALTAPARRAKAEDMARLVRLDAGLLDRYPSELSGGQLQRIAIARALITAPKLVVLDEPTSSLDLSVRAEIIQLLREMQRAVGAAYLFITHDLGTVRQVAQRVIVLYLGQVMESGPAGDVLAHPRHPYSRALMAAELSTHPGAARRAAPARGEPPSPLDVPRGCPFAARCAFTADICRAQRPALAPHSGRMVACWRAGDPALDLETAI